MKRTILIMLLSTLLLSCNNREKEPEREGMNTASLSQAMVAPGNEDIDTNTHKLGEEEEFPQDSSCEIVFFAECISLESRERVLQQIKELFDGDYFIHLNGDVLTICGVEFGVNVHKGNLALITSIHMDDPKMEPVIREISFYYDMMPLDSGSDVFYWCANPEYDTCEIVVRMRPLYSADGGTKIIFS